MYMKHNPHIQALVQAVNENVDESILNVAKVMEAMEVKALGVMHELMQDGNHAIKFKAAQDLLDRGNRTSKVQRVQSTSISLTGEDAKEIAAQLVASRRVRERFAEEVKGDWDRIEQPKEGAA